MHGQLTFGEEYLDAQVPIGTGASCRGAALSPTGEALPQAHLPGPRPSTEPRAEATGMATQVGCLVDNCGMKSP